MPLGWKLARLSCKGILMSKRKAIAVFLQSVTTRASPLPPSPQAPPQLSSCTPEVNPILLGSAALGGTDEGLGLNPLSR